MEPAVPEPLSPIVPEGEPEPEEPEEKVPVPAAPPAQPAIRAVSPFPAARRIADLTPLQQAIVLKEILDEPIALRRDLR